MYICKVWGLNISHKKKILFEKNLWCDYSNNQIVYNFFFKQIIYNLWKCIVRKGMSHKFYHERVDLMEGENLPQDLSYVDIMVNGVVPRAMPTKPLDMLVSQERVNPLIYVRCVRHASDRLYCCEMERFPRQRFCRLSFSHQCLCIECEPGDMTFGSFRPRVKASVVLEY
jgi:hypothetical protein